MSRKIDYLATTHPTESRFALISILAEYLGPGESTDKFPGWYREAHVWVHEGLAAAVAWSEGRAECFVEIRGTGCGIVGASRFPQLLARLAARSASCTRIDLTIDDHSRQLVDLEAIEQAANVGNFTGFRLVAALAPRKRVDGEMKIVGRSITFGRKGRAGGLAQVIFYDKTLESAGVVDAIRMEARFFKGKAHAVFVALAALWRDEDAFWKLVSERAAGAIDFVEREGSYNHRDRMTRLPWWQAVIDALGNVVTRIDRPKAALLATAQWIKDGCLRSIAKVFEAIELQGMDAGTILVEAVQRIRPQLYSRWEPTEDDLECDYQGILIG